jgi:RNA polymerase sigma-70 factor (ECF subfamily)
MTDEDFCALYDAHARRLWAYVMRATKNAAVADDIVQETFVRVLGAKTMAEADPDHRRHYLFKIATNLIKRQYGRAVELAPQHSGPYVAATPSDERLAVEQALDTLSTTERQTLWLAYAEGWSWREVAEMLGYREGSVRQVAVRAKRRFREAFGMASKQGRS